MARTTDLALIQKRRNLQLERQEKARAEAQALADRMAETRARGEARGEEFEQQPKRRGEQDKPLQRVTGLAWLYRKGKLTDDQFAAGSRYGACYRMAKGEASIRSILNRDVAGGEGPTLEALMQQSERNEQARAKLAMYRNQMQGEVTIITACDLICGDELTPREAAQNGRDATALEVLMIAGLSMMAQHLAPSRTCDSQKPQDVEKAA